MSALLVGLADILVAILLVATIVTSVRLSRHIATFKSGEAAMRVQVGELVAATERAERAVAGLREAVTDGERSLAAKLGAAQVEAARLEEATAGGRAVMERLDAIVTASRKVAGVALAAGPAIAASAPPLAAEPRPTAERPRPVGNETLRAAMAAVEALTERAARRGAA